MNIMSTNLKLKTEDVRTLVIKKRKVIPFFDYTEVFSSTEEELVDVFKNVLRRGAFIQQSDLDEFEENLAKFLGVKYAFGVANCTDGMIIAMRAIGIKPGDEVIFPSHTFVASAASIHFTGGTPVPVECGPDHLIDPAAIEKAITSKTKAILPVQLNGRTCDMEAIQKIADKHGLKIIEDSAQALGSKFKNRSAGSFGDAAAFSFYPAKTLGCFGDGGAVVTNDDEIAKNIFMLRDHGRDNYGEIVDWGLNSRLDNLQAAILNFKFSHYKKAIDYRRKIARLYDNNLNDLPDLLLPPAPDSDPDHFDIYQNYEIEANRRDDLREYLDQAGIKTILQWGGSAVHQFEKLGLDCKLPITEKMMARSFLLPINTMITEDDVRYICGKIREFYNH
jgi:dTDP-4-amino-4,6-dideoxygalactose transaminase